jgi:hypothetical protein
MCSFNLRAFYPEAHYTAWINLREFLAPEAPHASGMMILFISRRNTLVQFGQGWSMETCAFTNAS